MPDSYLRAFEADLERTQRAIAANCLFCVPQPRSLVADEPVTTDDLATHFLSPAVDGDPLDGATALMEHRPGAYETLNGKRVAVVGSYICTGRGFDEKRKVRILLSEQRELAHQAVTVLHVSRPLVGGVALPEDPNEMDVATFRRYTAILRSFPENELVFYQLDATIAQVHKICEHNQFADRYETTLPALLREEWEWAVDELLHGGAFEEDTTLPGATHVLQVQQVVECYLMEPLHDHIFPQVRMSCAKEELALHDILYRMRHYTPEDFGIQPAFQCYLLDARDELMDVKNRKTPLDMLLAFKSCIDRISDALTFNLKQHRLDFGSFQMTTDDILDQLLFLLTQAFNAALLADAKAALVAGSTPRSTSTTPTEAFPVASILRYISDYHFINSNTTALGFTIANFQVAVEYFLLRASHLETCRACDDVTLRPPTSPHAPPLTDALGRRGSQGSHRRCSQSVFIPKCELAHERNLREIKQAIKPLPLERHDSAQFLRGDSSNAWKQLFLVGSWSKNEVIDDEKGAREEPMMSVDRSAVQRVEFSDESDANIIHISGGHRFFAAVMDDGRLYTWGDSSGGRLGYQLPDGSGRRVDRPCCVASLESKRVVQVACGAFHTLVTDINGHVFAWGSNARGQLGFLAHSSSTTFVDTPTHVAELRGVYMRAVACGEYHSLAMSSNGLVFSWGCNRYFKLGRRADTFIDALQPRLVPCEWLGVGIDTRTPRQDAFGESGCVVVRIAAGKDHSLAVTSDGAVFSWGRGDTGQLGHGCRMDVPEPRQIMALSDADAFAAMDVAGGSTFSLVLLRTGAVFVTGQDPSQRQRETLCPHLLTLSEAIGPPNVIGVAAGEAHFALLLGNGSVLLSQQLPDEQASEATEAEESDSRRRRWTEEFERALTRVELDLEVKRFACGASHTLLLV